VGQRVLAIGMEELKRKQDLFEAAAKEIDPKTKAIEVFKNIQKDHPTAESLIPDTAKNLEMIRQFVVDHRIITIPSKVRARVAETPQFMRARFFAVPRIGCGTWKATRSSGKNSFRSALWLRVWPTN